MSFQMKLGTCYCLFYKYILHVNNIRSLFFQHCFIVAELSGMYFAHFNHCAQEINPQLFNNEQINK